MNSLLSRAVELQHAAHTLMYLGMDGEPLYSDNFCVRIRCSLKIDSHFAAKSYDIEEEPIVSGSFDGFTMPLYTIMVIRSRTSRILVRACDVLERLPDS
jgi:hypothetical protein